jgi:hypothetical protein
MAACAHSVCTCEARKGERFCSDFCEANPQAAECHCHHESCDAPHHH